MLVFANNNKFARYNNKLAPIARFIFLCLILLLFIIQPVVQSLAPTCQAVNTKLTKSLYTEQSIEEEIAENIDTQLGDIDFADLDKTIGDFSSTKEYLGSNSFIDVVRKFINAEDASLYSNFINYAISAIFDNLLSYLPYFAIIIVFAIAFSLISQFANEKNKSMSNLLHIVIFSAIAVIVLKLVLGLLGDTKSVIEGMESQIEIIFPILLTLITAIGASTTTTTFQPLLVIISSGIAKLFTYVLLPLFVFSIIFGVVGNLSKNVKMDKFSKFFSSLFNWIIGIVFTMFVAFLTIHGLTVSSIDTISFKTAKFAIKSYVPLLGGYLSDGINVIIASSVLIKNAVGVSGLIIMIGTIFMPIIKIILVVLLLKLSSAILEPICDKETPDFLYAISKSLNMLIVSIMAVALMYMITTSLLLSCSNLL